MPLISPLMPVPFPELFYYTENLITLTSTEPPSLSAGVKLAPSNSVDCLISAQAEPLCVAN